MLKIRRDSMQTLQIIVNVFLIVMLIKSMDVNIKRIKSNNEVIKKDNEILQAQKELKEKLTERNEIARKTQDEITKVKENCEELKLNVSLDYDHLTEEVIKRINEKQKMNTKAFINV